MLSAKDVNNYFENNQFNKFNNYAKLNSLKLSIKCICTAVFENTFTKSQFRVRVTVLLYNRNMLAFH
jgi:hypothetical protein